MFKKITISKQDSSKILYINSALLLFFIFIVVLLYIFQVYVANSAEEATSAAFRALLPSAYVLFLFPVVLFHLIVGAFQRNIGFKAAIFAIFSLISPFAIWLLLYLLPR